MEQQKRSPKKSSNALSDALLIMSRFQNFAAVTFSKFRGCHVFKISRLSRFQNFAAVTFSKFCGWRDSQYHSAPKIWCLPTKVYSSHIPVFKKGISSQNMFLCYAFLTVEEHKLRTLLRIDIFESLYIEQVWLVGSLQSYVSFAKEHHKGTWLVGFLNIEHIELPAKLLWGGYGQ